MAYATALLALLDIRTALVGLLAFLVLSWALRRPRNLPPGPWEWPLLGSLPTLALASGEPYEVFLKMSKKYGPIFTLSILGQRIIVVHGYDAIKDAFQNPSLNDRPESHMITNMLDGSVGKLK